MMGVGRRLTILFLSIVISVHCYSQGSVNEKGFFFVDTLDICNPVLVVLDRPKKYRPSMILMSSEELHLLEHRRFRMTKNLIIRSGFYTLSLGSARAILEKENLKYKNDDIARLIKDITHEINEGHENSAIKYYTNEEIHSSGIKVYRTDAQKYFIFLVNGSTLNEWTKKNDYKFSGVNNLYIPVAFPAFWLQSEE